MQKNCLLLICILFFSIPLFAKTSKSEKLLSKKELNYRKSAISTQKYIDQAKIDNKKTLENFINKTPLEKKIAQLFIENLEGNSNFKSYENYSVITGKKNDEPVIAGGYLFFSYNLCDTVENQKAFMQEIKDYSLKNNQLPPYLAIDQEGGYVNRLRKLTEGLPSQQKVSQNYSVLEAYQLYYDQGYKMNNLGFNMNIAPVIEVCTEDNKDFLNGRSFGNYENVIDYGNICVRAYENTKIATVIKHFPGNTNTDPHTGLPEIDLSKEDLMTSILSFKEILEQNPTAILMSHARTKAIDENIPACLSKVWVTDILRNEWGYKGIIFSDDIFMGALADNGYPPEKAVIMAIEAGVDCIMTSEKRFGKQAKVMYDYAKTNPDFENRINESFIRVLNYKINSGIITYEDLK